nr:primase-helicase family protein [Tropicimonas sp. IMCC6043]
MWAPFLYSRRKGTGKSTLCQLVSHLFGQANSKTQNSVEKLTGKFNSTMLLSKLIISEELKLKPDSSQGNTLKTYITEAVTTSEAKGREVQQVRQCCCFLFTSNHLPLWIEADDRRYYVIDVDHDGHASGPRAKEFQELVGRVRNHMEDEESLAALYHRLMDRRQAGDFDATSLNLATASNPIMMRIQNSSRQVVLEQLEEHLAEIKQFAVPQEDLIEFIKRDLGGNANQLRHLMSELRWRNEKVKWDGKDFARAIWVHPDYWVDRGHVHGPEGYKAKIGAMPGSTSSIDVEFIDAD